MTALVVTAGCSSASSDTFSAQKPGDAGADVADDVTSDAADDVRREPEPDAAEDAPVDVENAYAPVGSGTLQKLSYAGPEGTRDYLLYEPAGYDGTPLPLVVALHGCSQTASHFAYVTGFNQLADAKGFLVAWPEQTLAANSGGCWNWFLPGHQQRTTGEAAIIAGIVQEVKGTHAVDDERVYATGISAGAAMAIVMAAVFPDRFAAVSSVEGCPFQGTPCIGSASVLPAETLAGYAFQAMGSYARAVPVMVVQGDIDFNVPLANGELIVQQWLGVADRADDGSSNQSVSRQPDHTDKGTAPGGHSYDTAVYVDGNGAPLVERWLVHGLGHAWPGGAPAVAYSDPMGPSATEESYRFFEAHPMP